MAATYSEFTYKNPSVFLFIEYIKLSQKQSMVSATQKFVDHLSTWLVFWNSQVDINIKPIFFHIYAHRRFFIG